MVQIPAWAHKLLVLLPLATVLCCHLLPLPYLSLTLASLTLALMPTACTLTPTSRHCCAALSLLFCYPTILLTIALPTSACPVFCCPIALPAPLLCSATASFCSCHSACPTLCCPIVLPALSLCMWHALCSALPPCHSALLPCCSHALLYHCIILLPLPTLCSALPPCCSPLLPVLHCSATLLLCLPHALLPPSF